MILDTRLTDDLVAEGYARDTIRVVQDARKEAGLDISDRISLKLAVPAAHAGQIKQFESLICSETLATRFAVEISGSEAVDASVSKA